MAEIAPSSNARPVRLAGLDIARSAALLAMAVYHFVFDLQIFGLIAPGTATSGAWRVLALCTAGSFLALAGVSLWLAHGQGIRWRSFWRRFGMVAGAALLITAATYVAMPGAFIFFGILHSIALASVIGLACLRLPALSLIALAGLAFWVPGHLASDLFNPPYLWWVGLHTVPVTAVDYVPLFPWIGPFLLGLAFAKLMSRFDAWPKPAPDSPSRLIRALSFPGRHSLIVYLVHQPILISLIWLALWIA